LKHGILRRSKEMNENNSAFPVFDGRGGADYSCVDGGLTARQYAAIHLKVPRSGDPELDAMIRESQRLQLVGQVAAGIMTNPNDAQLTPSDMAKICCNVADAILAEWEKEANREEGD
jgi:hypothetical protein